MGGAAGSAAGSAGTAGTAGSTLDGGEDAAAGSAGAPADGGEEASSAASWTQVYTTVIAQKCTPCHTTPSGGGILNGKLDMTSQATAYSNLVNAPAAGSGCSGKGTRVKAGLPDESIMYLKVSLDDPSPCGAKMPLGGPELSQDEVNLIESWITGGALDD